MFDINKKPRAQKKSGINPILAGVTGAVMGAGVAIAASQVLKKEKTRKKVKDAFENVKDQTIDYVQNFKTEPKLKKEVKEIKKVAKKT